MITVSTRAARSFESTPRRSSPPAPRWNAASVSGAIALALVLILALPIFLCMPLWADVTMYDAIARELLQGAVLYRDLFDTNFPGMILIQTGLRWTLGWRSETLRAIDLAVVAAIVALLMRWMRELGASRAAVVWTTFALASFYLFRPESVHGQRDVWMLLPSLAAARLRVAQVRRLEWGGPTALIVASAALEGALWGVAAWIKPFALLPAGFCWLTGSAAVRARRDTSARAAAIDGVALALGLLAVTAAVCAWLVRSGAWPWFVDTMIRWNPEYSGHAYEFAERRTAIEFALRGTKAWSYAYLFALPAAALLVVRGLRRSVPPGVSGPSAAVLGALFFAWLFQVALLQPRVHDYSAASLLLLGIAIGFPLVPPERPLAWLRAAGLAAFAIIGGIGHPVFHDARLASWIECQRSGSTSRLREQLALQRASNGHTDWPKLDAVAAYLASRTPGPRDVLCFSESTHPLYAMLGAHPIVRYLQFNVVVHDFRTRRAQISDEIAAARPRFVVSDVTSIGMGADWPLELMPGPWRERYPWNLPVVFRAGRYLVHEPGLPVTRFWP